MLSTQQRMVVLQFRALISVVLTGWQSKKIIHGLIVHTRKNGEEKQKRERHGTGETETGWVRIHFT